ncbi:MAG: hypothetical protein GX367_03260 [Bacteroidales bacterium]|nr:hypothetical protein [Bacteroidales bacterium]
MKGDDTMYILITSDNVYQGRTLKSLRKKSKLSLEDVQFERIGTSKVASIRDEEVYEILSDKLLIENTALNKLFKNDIGISELVLFLNTLFLLVLLIRK